VWLNCSLCINMKAWQFTVKLITYFTHQDNVSLTYSLQQGTKILILCNKTEGSLPRSEELATWLFCEQRFWRTKCVIVERTKYIDWILHATYCGKFLYIILPNTAHHTSWHNPPYFLAQRAIIPDTTYHTSWHNPPYLLTQPTIVHTNTAHQTSITALHTS